MPTGRMYGVRCGIIDQREVTGGVTITPIAESASLLIQQSRKVGKLHFREGTIQHGGPWHTALLQKGEGRDAVIEVVIVSQIGIEVIH